MSLVNKRFYRACEIAEMGRALSAGSVGRRSIAGAAVVVMLAAVVLMLAAVVVMLAAAVAASS
jgi:hypothetical protein